MAKTEVKPAEATPNMVYVEIPAKDLFDKPFDGVWNNRNHYKPGQTYLLEEAEAAFIKERLELWRAEQIRQLRPNADPRIINDVAKMR